MKMLNRFSQLTALCGCAILLCFSLAAGADELQDIGKLFKQGKQDEALTRVDAYLEKKPKDAQARFLRGLILTEQGKNVDAIKAFTALTEDFPELPEPYNNLAVLYANQGQYDKARIALEMAIRTNPSYATAHENLGDIYAKMASQAYDRALQLDHSNTATQTKLAMIKELFASGNGQEEASAKPAAEEKATQQAAAEPKTEARQEAENKPKSGNITKDVLEMVNAWADAWAAQDVKSYLSYYADDFDTGRRSRADWEALRDKRLTYPKYIKITVLHPKVKLLNDTHASVKFRQSYNASHLRSTSDKTLILVKTDKGWQIEEENSR